MISRFIGQGASLAIGGLAFVIIITCYFTMRVIRVVDLVGAIRYLWVILWILPFEFFFNISLFVSFGRSYQLSLIRAIWDVSCHLIILYLLKVPKLHLLTFSCRCRSFFGLFCHFQRITTEVRCPRYGLLVGHAFAVTSLVDR